jgi:hypothetical protein
MKLTGLYCAGNQLKELPDLPVSLYGLNCGYNLLTGLDVSNNMKLAGLDCSYNYMKSVDDVAGWREIGLVLSENFYFYPQRTLTDSFQVGSDRYDTLEEAVAAAQDGGMITMLRDVALNGAVYINTNKTYTVDLGGYKLTNEGDMPYLLRITTGKLTIQNGCAVNTSGTAINVPTGGTLYILDGEYVGYNDAIYAPGGIVVITSGHFVCTDDLSRDGCLVGGQITLADGSIASVTPYKNNPDAIDVTITVGEPAIMYGDTDGDGRITPFDATLVLQHIVGIVELDGRALKAADTDHDGRITPYDATMILQYIAGMITSLD